MSQRRRQNHFWQKVPSPQAKNARVGMSRPHTSLTTAVVLIFPKVCGFCGLFPSLLNLALPSWIHSVPPLFALVSEGNSSRQKGSVCVVYSRVSSGSFVFSPGYLACAWICEVPQYAQGEPSCETPVVAPPVQLTLLLCFFVGESEAVSKWKVQSLWLKPCNTRRGISLLSVDTATNTHQHKQHF